MTEKRSPQSLSHFIPLHNLTKGRGGVHFRKGGVHFLIIPHKRKKNKAHKTGSCKAYRFVGFYFLCSDAHLRAVIEYESDLAVPMDDCLLNHNSPDSIVPFL